MPAEELEKARALAKGRFVLRLENPQGMTMFGLRREVLEGQAVEPDEVSPGSTPSPPRTSSGWRRT